MQRDKNSDPVRKGRRHYLKRDLRRAQIVAAARPVFASKGFHATSIDEIIAAAGVAQGTLYLHFANKHEVFHAVMQDALARITDIVKPLSDSEIPVSVADTDAVFAYIKKKNQRLLTAVRDDRDLFRIILREAPGLDRETDEILSRIHAVIVGQVQTELSIFRNIGLIGPMDPRLAAPMVVGTMIMAIIHFLIGGDMPDLESLAEEITRFQFYGYGKGPVIGREA